MGTWGVGIFDDDVALDVRSGFRELVAAGCSSEDATQRLLTEFSSAFEDDPAEVSAAWIALAMVQWKTGRLLDWVRDRALRAIADESSDIWSDAKLWRRRQRVLATAATTLRSPQRTPVRIARQRVAQSPYLPGDVLRYVTDSGREVALWAMRNRRHQGLTAVDVNTEFQLAAFGDLTLPSVAEIVAAEPVVLTNPDGWRHLLHFSFIQPQDAQGPRWQVIGNVPFPAEREVGGHQIMFVKERRGRPGADTCFESLYRRSVGEDSPAVRAVQRLVDACPELSGFRRSWPGWPQQRAEQVAIAVGESLAAGTTARAHDVLSVTEALASGDRAGHGRRSSSSTCC